MSILSIADEVAGQSSRLRSLEMKSRDDDALIKLLNQQKQELSDYVSNIISDHEVTLFALKQERDAAVSRAKDVAAIIETISNTALAGLRRMAGDHTMNSAVATPSRPAVDSRVGNMVSALDDKRIPRVSP